VKKKMFIRRSKLNQNALTNFSGDWMLKIMLIPLLSSWKLLLSGDQIFIITFNHLKNAKKTFGVLNWSPEIWPPKPPSN
jgi:hypothetical protein